MGGVMKYFPKKLLGHEIFRSMVSWALIFFEKFVKSYDIFNVRSLIQDFVFVLFQQKNEIKREIP